MLATFLHNLFFDYLTFPFHDSPHCHSQSIIFVKLVEQYTHYDSSTMQHVALFSVLLVSLSVTASARYQLVQDYSGENFFQEFDFFTDPDPTQGHVVYKDMVSANATGLAGLIDGGNATNAVYMGVDTMEVAPDGRGSVRVTSKQSYQHFLMIADIVHMPGGVCGTWPAFWTVGKDVSGHPHDDSALLIPISGRTMARSTSLKVSTSNLPTP